MRISNKRVNSLIETVYSLLFLGLFFSIVMLFIPIASIVKYVEPYVLIGVFALLIFGLYRLGPHSFEYNSDGETLNIRTQDPFWVKYFPQNRKMTDFPKMKVVKFQIKNRIIKKQLVIYIRSKRSQNGVSKLTYNIGYLSRSEINDIKTSLNRMIKRNKENSHWEDVKTDDID